MSELQTESVLAAAFPLNEPTYIRIKRAIIGDLFARVLRPGSHITIDMLTTRYGVSHMPVREALRQLEGEGVIVSHAHKGFRVAEITESYIRNVYDIRIGIESLLARRAVEQGTDDQFAELAAIHAQFLLDLDDPDRLRATRTNVLFHQRLYEIANNAEAMQALEGRTLVVRTFGSTLSGYRDEDRPLVRAEHQSVMDAIMAGDAVRCGQAIFDHVTAARERLVERMIQKHVIELGPEADPSKSTVTSR
ncbi:MAG TPA: GntR family transcriptional regulator [Devosiaceae bacterium]|jgi:DNA-binding GntR family transcriptional regulator